jgi:hypothetical protein
MKTYVNHSHSKNLGSAIGEFCGTPIYQYDPLDLEVDDLLDVQNTVQGNRAMEAAFSVIPVNIAEVMPGETVCADNIIRRVTTAEAEGREVTTAIDKHPELGGRPKEKTTGQSTVENLCAWLDNNEKLNRGKFTHIVEVVGEDKVMTAFSKKGVALYSFRYFGGIPGTYIGGDEIRLFTKPQEHLHPQSASRVVECYVPIPDAPPKEYVELKEWADEFKCTFAPTPHVDRITIGGTALLDDLRREIELSKAAQEPEIVLSSASLEKQACEWYPDGENQCGAPITHAATQYKAGVCDSCHAQREKRDRE